MVIKQTHGFNSCHYYILVTTTTTMRITFVNLPAILLALVVGAAALPNIIDRDDYNPNSNGQRSVTLFIFIFIGSPVFFLAHLVDRLGG
jgi:hypothetical protein